jgi:hypothetical protein
MSGFMSWLDSHAVGDWIALGVVLLGLVCLSVADWRRSNRSPRPRR